MSPRPSMNYAKEDDLRNLLSEHTQPKREEPEQRSCLQRCFSVLKKYSHYIGPGLMVSVAYMDPGNYSTAVAAGSSLKYKLLCSVFLSNVLAAFLQALCAKLGSVTGLDLAQNCRENLPPKLNVVLYILAEIAIIATDLAEVVGTAIALNILFGLPLIIGVILTVVDVLVVLLAYRPEGPLFVIRVFEAFVSILVIATVVCFGVELINVAPYADAKQVFAGFLPSKEIVSGDGLYLTMAIFGATIMPHSLYLGSGLVQPRLREYDIKNGNFVPEGEEAIYKPSLDAINDSMTYTLVELVVSLFTVAFFVNASILIVAGATLYSKDGSADLFSIYNMLCEYLSKPAGVVFALALLFSGQSAGVVCTLAGQMVSEGFLRWTISPAVRRLLTRAVAIAPCLILVIFSGSSGLSAVLNASQVILSLLLPFVSAPLIYFTCNKSIMRVEIFENDGIAMEDFSQESPRVAQYKDMSNGPIVTWCAVIIWGLITLLNLYLLVSLAMGREVV